MKVSKDVTKLQNIYYNKGFLDVNIAPRLAFTNDKSKVRITFVINEGYSYTAEDIIITGNKNFDTERLQSECLGETPAALAWAKARLEEIKTQGVQPVLLAIAELDKKVRSPAKKKQLRLLRNYLLKRLEMLDYKGALAKGWDIGSGPTESMCKNLTLRLKRPGMKWDPSNAEAMMNLTALYESGQKKSYWSMRKAA